MKYGTEGPQAENRTVSYSPETRPPRYREECLYCTDDGGCKMKRRCMQTDMIGDCRLIAFKNSIYAGIIH